MNPVKPEINSQNTIKMMNFIFNATWLQVLFTVIALFLIRVCWRYVRLWLYLQGLKKKGAVVHFNPPIGLTRKFEIDNAEKDDDFAWFKETVQKNPGLRLLATHCAHKPILFLVDPNLVKVFLSDITKSAKTSLLEPMYILMRHGLLFSHGNQWKRHRKTLSTIFRYEFLMSQIPTIVNTTRHILSREIEAQKGKHINILELYQMITGELVFRIFFGEDLEGVTIDGLPLTTYLAHLCDLGADNSRAPENILFGVKGVKLGLFKRNRDYLRQTQKFLNFCTEMIQNKKTKLEEAGKTPGDGPTLGEGSDLLTLMLQEQKQSKGTADEFTDEEILHEFITFFFAGMDTTGHMVTMATYFFAKQSEEEQKTVLKEADELSQAGTNITKELLNKSEAIHAVLKETLRMATPACFLFPREMVGGSQSIGDIPLLEGTLTNISIITNNYNPRLYPDPYKFNMNRWIQGSPDFAEEAHKNPYYFTPFSAGPRNCIGQHLAIIEGKIILSIFLSTYNFTLPAGYEMHYKWATAYEPRETLYLDIEKK